MNIEYDTLTEVVRDEARKMCSEERLKHVFGVERLARKLSRIHGVNSSKAGLVAVSHDIFRDRDEDELIRLSIFFGIETTEIERTAPVLLHGKIAACYLREKHGIEGDIFQALFWHVSGTPGMTLLGKILMISDIGEEGRTFPEALQIRKAAELDLEKSFADVIRLKIAWAVTTGSLLLPETVWTWNELLGGANHVSN